MYSVLVKELNFLWTTKRTNITDGLHSPTPIPFDIMFVSLKTVLKSSLQGLQELQWNKKWRGIGMTSGINNNNSDDWDESYANNFVQTIDLVATIIVILSSIYSLICERINNENLFKVKEKYVRIWYQV